MRFSGWPAGRGDEMRGAPGRVGRFGRDRRRPAAWRALGPVQQLRRIQVRAQRFDDAERLVGVGCRHEIRQRVGEAFALGFEHTPIVVDACDTEAVAGRLQARAGEAQIVHRRVEPVQARAVATRAPGRPAAHRARPAPARSCRRESRPARASRARARPSERTPAHSTGCGARYGVRSPAARPGPAVPVAIMPECAPGNGRAMRAIRCPCVAAAASSCGDADDCARIRPPADDCGRAAIDRRCGNRRSAGHDNP